MDVEDVTLVIRAHPIRVAGDSGELHGETTWAEIAEAAGLPDGYCELTSEGRGDASQDALADLRGRSLVSALEDLRVCAWTSCAATPDE